MRETLRVDDDIQFCKEQEEKAKERRKLAAMSPEERMEYESEKAAKMLEDMKSKNAGKLEERKKRDEEDRKRKEEEEAARVAEEEAKRKDEEARLAEEKAQAKELASMVEDEDGTKVKKKKKKPKAGGKSSVECPVAAI